MFENLCTTGIDAVAFGIAPNNNRPCYTPGVAGKVAVKAVSWLSRHGVGYVLGWSANLAGTGVAGEYTHALVSDTNGNVGMMSTISVSGISSIGLSGSGGVVFGTSNYSSLSGYGGFGVQATLSVVCPA